MNYQISWNLIQYAIYIFLSLSSLVKGSFLISSYYLIWSVMSCVLLYFNHHIYLLYSSIVMLFFMLTYCYSSYNGSLEDSFLPVVVSIYNIGYTMYKSPKYKLLDPGFLHIISVTMAIILFLVSLLNITLVLLQRGEEGVFSRDNLSNQFASEDKTMNNSTMFFGTIYIVLSFFLSVIVYLLNR